MSARAYKLHFGLPMAFIYLDIHIGLALHIRRSIPTYIGNRVERET